MTLLTIIQDAADDLGITRPSTVISNTTTEARQLLRLANKEGYALANRFQWQEMVRENTFTMVATQNQGAINGTVVSDSDFDYIMPGTVWNRTTDLPIIGSTEETDWQLLQSFNVTGPFERYRIQNDNFYINPAPTAGHTLAFEYMSTSWCESSGGTGQSEWAADTDVPVLDAEIMTLGIIWRWRQRKGLDYAEDFQEYERRVVEAENRNKSGKTLSLNGNFEKRFPGTIVPIGSWNL